MLTSLSSLISRCSGERGKSLLTELTRLGGVPCMKVSNSQRMGMCGKGWILRGTNLLGFKLL